MSGKYDDIIGLPHHVSSKRAQMSLANRASQFAPFATLRGHNEAIVETARLTENFFELSTHEQDILSKKVNYILSLTDKPTVNIRYFIPDIKKQGGHYVSITSRIKKLDEVSQMLILIDKTEIPLNMVSNIDGEILSDMEF